MDHIMDIDNTMICFSLLYMGVGHIEVIEKGRKNYLAEWGGGGGGIFYEIENRRETRDLAEKEGLPINECVPY